MNETKTSFYVLNYTHYRKKGEEGNDILGKYMENSIRWQEFPILRKKKSSNRSTS